jgi:uncharacterized protein YodC (DUF2158 family)
MIGLRNVAPGDVCQLASGGPVMTASHWNHKSKDYIVCEWFVGDKRYQEVFGVLALRRVEDQESTGESSHA